MIKTLAFHWHLKNWAMSDRTRQYPEPTINTRRAALGLPPHPEGDQTIGEYLKNHGFEGPE